MRKFWMAALLTAALAGGCASTNSSPPPTTSPQGQAISVSDVPTAIIAAFTAEHPYDKIHDPREITDANGSTRYVIPYIRPDGSEGRLTYAPTGESLSGY